MKIWAHRGCSQRYPENTLLAFEKAAELEGLAGIELDIQLTRDDRMVVIHDERIDRTTNGTGYVKDYTLDELKKFNIVANNDIIEHIPTIEEVLNLLKVRMLSGKLKLNIELKNNVFPYNGMEEKIVELVSRYKLEKSVIYSSFYAKSLEKIRRIAPKAEIGILDTKASDCIYKLKGGCGANAIHPYWKSLDRTAEVLKSYTVRAWMTGHLYPEPSTGTKLDIEILKQWGITDIFLNEPERYLG